ncbi:hypothetical protein DENSPDRAFT_904004 [Dentipellis sp. KUC8613]|nr:hypothetical protein DENSPDRAFT_904004 [Dentipellis sp. KUC8613]
MLKLSRHVKRAIRPTHPAGLCLRRWLSTEVGLWDDLETRGFISQVTKPEKLRDALKSRQAVYSGVDPTARSLHVGHLLPMMCLLHFHIRGHHIIPLIGGATALIGDPSGRSTERPHLERAKVEANMNALTSTVETFFERASLYAASRHSDSTHATSKVVVRNNIEWFDTMGLLEFVRTVGVHARVNGMLARESVQSRLNSQQGISFAEFSYQLLQAYDFVVLNKREGCTIQIGGSDQWGNIVAGIDLISRTHPETEQSEASATEKGFGITVPLLTTASGEKIGKSAGNAVWLNDSLTSVFDFYQYFLRTTDEDVERLLKLFTLVPLEKVEEVMQIHRAKPEDRTAQKLLADEVTDLVHTGDGLRNAHAATRLLFDTDVSNTRAADAVAALSGDPRLHYVDREQLFSTPVSKLAVNARIVASNSAAKQLVSMGGLYLNGKPVQQGQTVTPGDLLDERVVILRSGKSNHAILVLK